MKIEIFQYAMCQGFALLCLILSQDNYKSTLQEICQKNGCGLPEYKLECEGGTPDNPHFEVSVTVEWNGEVLVERATATEKKKEVEKMAAKKMVERLSSGITTVCS